VELVEVSFVGELFVRPDSSEALDEFSTTSRSRLVVEHCKFEA
jgi:hypothetical protein